MASNTPDGANNSPLAVGTTSSESDMLGSQNADAHLLKNGSLSGEATQLHFPWDQSFAQEQPRALFDNYLKRTKSG